MSVEDGEGTEEILMARDVGRSTPADGEAGDENVRAVDLNAWKRQHLMHGIHNVAMVLRHSL